MNGAVICSRRQRLRSLATPSAVVAFLTITSLWIHHTLILLLATAQAVFIARRLPSRPYPSARCYILIKLLKPKD